MNETHKNRERGVVLMLLALMAVVLFACLGAASDFGRMFIAKHEAQVFSDASALAAAGQLDGTQSGASNAVSAVDDNANKWNFGSQAFSGASGSHSVTFSTSLAGPWTAAASLPSPPVNYKFVKVQASLTMPLYFISVLVAVTSQRVNTMAVAGQTPITSLYEGAFPFTPMSFDPVDPTVGFTKDVQYTIRYPSTGAKPPCAGDKGIHSKDAASRGYWGDAGSSVIEQRIVDDFQSGAVATIGQNIFLSLGAKTTESAYMDERSNQDPDQSSKTWAAYKASATGNGRRLVVMPITNFDNGIALGFASFLMLPSGNYDHTGNASWCVVYVGPWTQGQQLGGSSSTAGAYRIGLVE